MRAVSFCRKCPLSEGMRGQKQNLPDIALSGSFSEGAVSVADWGSNTSSLSHSFAVALSHPFLHKINLSILLFFLLAAGAFLSLQQERNQSAGQEERGGLKQPLFLPTPTITPHFSDVFIRLHRRTQAVCTPFFIISVYSDLCSLSYPVCLRLSIVNVFLSKHRSGGHRPLFLFG